MQCFYLPQSIKMLLSLLWCWQGRYKCRCRGCNTKFINIILRHYPSFEKSMNIIINITKVTIEICSGLNFLWVNVTCTCLYTFKKNLEMTILEIKFWWTGLCRFLELAHSNKVFDCQLSKVPFDEQIFLDSLNLN